MLENPIAVILMCYKYVFLLIFYAFLPCFFLFFLEGRLNHIGTGSGDSEFWEGESVTLTARVTCAAHYLPYCDHSVFI